MVAVAVVLLFAIGMGFLGLVQPDLYFVAGLALLIGFIGLAVRLVDLLRWFQR